ncbi:hypothetical protein [Devosia submarina]|uniref:hypothetical protein n=1 Tax=Devosia submarina TaxID=1173082 RepID=UPI000D3CB636|nr:hypothetical protein [Devosia submarina]
MTASSFTITARNAAHLSAQVDRFIATLPEGHSFPVNFGRDRTTWWYTYAGHHEVTDLTFDGLVALIQQTIDDTLLGLQPQPEPFYT